MNHFAKVYSAQVVGISAHIITIEVDVTKKTLYAFSIVGLPDKAVEESRDRISAAIKHSGFSSPKKQNQKIVISLAPADIKKEGPSFDLPMAIAYLSAVEEISFNPENKLFLGELSLDGTLRAVKGVLVLVRKAQELGFKEVFLPKDNATEGALIDGIKIYGAGTLKEVANHLNEKNKDKLKDTSTLTASPKTKIKYTDSKYSIDMSDVKGQESGKRGLEIAAAGRHNVCMYGPPGTGKTMLARAFSNILPDLCFEEVLEVTGIHSVAGSINTSLITSAPFRSPHHTSSYNSIVGGGSFPRPGEITLAHRGVLFLDEFPEFEKRVIESLRQPMEDNVINISRVKGTETFPANFILIAAMNPCPCGNYGSDKECICNPSALTRYRRKLSGPIMDRIDLWIAIDKVDHQKLSSKDKTENNSFIKKRITTTRE
ncbi:MAG TPA: ATP-binding protein, partial [Candidatus Yonathbacteria bacterium]|nr:ATP-binding protein [Candidatus Yonathbacteria bacterium]